MYNVGAMSFQDIITLEPGKRGGRPCVRGLRVTVGDVLGWLAMGMDADEIVAEYPYLTREDVRACLEFAAAREVGAMVGS
jgi:uncharacterized protein (DUF433 family)